MPEKKNLYLDAEWYIGGEVFLIGYAYSTKQFGQLYDVTLSEDRFNKLLRGVKFIYFYGPDIGVIEIFFGIDLRRKFHCINLLKVFRHHLKLNSYKLADVEVKFGIVRKRTEYKKNIFQIWNDWKRRDKKKRILQYNEEDVVNMIRLWKKIRAQYKITTHYLIENELK